MTIRWSSLDDYIISLNRKAEATGRAERAAAIKKRIPRVPPPPKLSKIVRNLTSDTATFCLGAWFDCIHTAHCQLLVNSRSEIWVEGEAI